MTAALLAAALILPSPDTLTASYYGAAFHGRLTASGAVFDQDAMTCASPSLPFGAVLLLEHDGRTVAVTVTDRGPYAVDSVGRALHPLSPHPRRQLDISAGAMDALGGISAGVVTCRAWRLR